MSATMLARIALLFVLVPILELALLVRLGGLVGFGPTLGLVVLTGVLGAALARLEGLRTLAAVRAELTAGRLPGQALLDGLAILLGGAFLLTPGLLTDVAGFALLIPTSRRWLQRRLRRAFEGRLVSGQFQGGAFSAAGWAFGDPATRQPDLDPSKGIDQTVREP